MGMDVYGEAATSQVGEYFRNNVWWWRPLADYILRTHPELASSCAEWHSNSGDGLNAAESIALADALDADLASGAVDAYSTAYAAEVAALPREACNLCNSTGLRTDEIGVAHGYDKPRHPATGRGGCNGCAGVGTREHWAASYPFSTENVREFAMFLRASGGFKIL